MLFQESPSSIQGARRTINDAFGAGADFESSEAQHNLPLRDGVIVLGKHRSGTSAISGTLAKLGVDAPETPLAAHESNQKGRWESTELVAFHDELLASAGTPWRDWRQLNVDWYETPVAARFKQRARAILASEYGASGCFVHGDGVGDVNVSAVIELHGNERTPATVTAMQPPGRYGAIRFEGNRVTGFQEMPAGDGGWINSGFFALSPKVGDYIDGDSSVREREPMERLAAEEQLSVYFHHGFWQPMDTLRGKPYREELWASGKAPWKIW